MKLSASRDFFNSNAQDWDNITQHNPDKINYLLDKLALTFQDSVLDVGTGTGIILPFLLQKLNHRGSITAVDLAEKMIERARKKYGQYPIEFITGNVTSLHRPQTYKAIICYSVFPHFKNQEHTLQALHELLQNNGKLLVCHSEGRQAINSRHGEIKHNVISHPLPPIEETSNLFKKVGFQILDKEDTPEIYLCLGQKV